MDDQTLMRMLYFLAREIGVLSAYVGELRDEGKFFDLVEDEKDDRVNTLMKMYREYAEEKLRIQDGGNPSESMDE